MIVEPFHKQWPLGAPYEKHCPEILRETENLRGRKS